MRRTLVNAFIVLHLAVIWTWCLPQTFALRRPLTRLTSHYVLATGLWQGWSMFSPNPRRVDIRVGAEIEFADGAKTLYDFPQMDRLGYWERYRKERFRKWANDSLRLDTKKALWKPAAEWVARRYDANPSRVTRVRLIRRWRDIPPPKATGLLGRIEPPKRIDREHTFYEYIPRDAL